MATVKTTITRVATRGPPAGLRTSSGICARTTEPSNQNQETPRIDRYTALRSRARTNSGHVSRAGFQLGLLAGEETAAGMRRLARNSVAATATTKTNNHEETLLDPPTIPPTNDPSRIATEVPICTTALPPTSSVASRCCERFAYMSGPKKADCTPSGKRTANNAGTLST